MNVATTGLSQGDFHVLRVLSSGQMVDILALVAGGGSGGAVSSAQAPLSLAAGVLSIDLSSYLSAGAIATTCLL